MKYVETRDGYVTERRGKMVYGFCDKGCKPIIRPRLSETLRAMDQHAAYHHGQRALEVTEGALVLPLDVPPF